MMRAFDTLSEQKQDQSAQHARHKNTYRARRNAIHCFSAIWDIRVLYLHIIGDEDQENEALTHI